jgi:hypothetical protein
MTPFRHGPVHVPSSFFRLFEALIGANYADEIRAKAVCSGQVG